MSPPKSVRFSSSGEKSSYGTHATSISLLRNYPTLTTYSLICDSRTHAMPSVQSILQPTAPSPMSRGIIKRRSSLTNSQISRSLPSPYGQSPKKTLTANYSMRKFALPPSPVVFCLCSFHACRHSQMDRKYNQRLCEEHYPY